MKYIYNLFIVMSLVVLVTSCNDYLDINTNPNQATTVDVELILPQALTATAYSLNGFNTYGAQIGGYAANAGGYGGFNETVTYNYNAGNYSGLWSSVYDNLEDYQYMIDNSEDVSYSYFKAAAMIMKAYNFQLLVDAYDDIPYTEALQGTKYLTPAYDDAAAIYADLAKLLDDAISTINTAAELQENGTTMVELKNYDILFAGNLSQWKKLANTIKLRIMLRANGKVSFSDTSFDSEGFLATDALINPGFTRDVSRQNPAWNSWGYGYTGSAATKSWIPTKYIMSFYDGTKLLDTLRGAAIYYEFPATGTNQLGYENSSVPACPTGSFWYPASERDGKVAGDTTGVLKGPDAGYPAFTAAESYFLQAEAAVRGIVSGDGKTLFENGIKASFNYTYMLPDGTVSADTFATADKKIVYMAGKYKEANTNDYRVNFDKATSTEQKIEAIITQKYIALNFVNSHEGWNEYRRTGYPTVSGSNPSDTFASVASQSTRGDNLPTRILYPSTEVAYNGANVPQGISPFTSLIFWAK